MIQRCLVVMLVASLGVGCTSHYRGSPRVELGPLGYEPLTPAEYEITGDVEGSASGGRFLIFPYGDYRQSGSLIPSDSSDRQDRPLGSRVNVRWLVIGTLIAGPFGLLAALLFAPEPDDYLFPPGYGPALYDALEKTPGADAMLLPRFSTETTYIPLLWNSWRADVSGKAIRITKDATDLQP